MSKIVPLRNLAKFGVITDVDPFDLAPEAFSAGVNVRFRNGKISGAPVFRNVLPLSNTSPRFAFSSNPAAGLDLLFVGSLDGTVTKISGQTQTAMSVSGYVTSSVEATWSGVTLATVTYINRSDRAPWLLRTSDSQFQSIASFNTGADAWSSSWTCKILRTCGGALVALNVTKGATASPTMVKTSSIPLSGAVPASWDQTQANTLATENILADMEGGIVDACPLGSSLVILGQKEAWEMTPNGQLSEFNYTPLPVKKGSINANCSVELDGRIVVFGPDDIWETDGTSEKSICDGRVRDFIYASINMAKASRCFVVHNPKLTEIAFCYPSGDAITSTGFNLAGNDGCNRAAVWNYGNDTWTFDDLPFAFGGCAANLSNSVTFASVSGSFDSFGGSFQDQEDGFKRTPVFVGPGNAAYGLTASLYGQDLYGTGSTLAYPVDTNATRPRFLARDGIDLDEVGAELRGQKVLVSIYPQVRLGTNAAPLSINGGASENYNEAAVFVGAQTFDGITTTKCDFNAAGRYLSLTVNHADYHELTVAGLDFEFAITSKRG